ncbi:Negative regulator of mitosis like protein [Verticillium longisporum]|nr:Negative regulator of mitosis like protein [Verticillium longisporum]
MWEVPLGKSQSKWPRLVTLMDPLQDIGLVVTDSQSAQRAATRRGTSKSPYLLDPAEEILHIEEIQLPSSLQSPKNDPLILAVTVNREANTKQTPQLDAATICQWDFYTDSG